MANVQDCEQALTRLAGSLSEVDATARAKHVPRRTVSCTISDLDVVFTGRVDEHGVHDLRQVSPYDGSADVRVVIASGDLLALADGKDDLLHAWLKGRIQVSAPVRDMLRVRSLLGL